MEQLGDTTDDTAAAPRPGTSPPRPDRVIGGVAGTIAARLGLDPLWVRLGFVVLGLAGGVGVVLYAAAWLVLVGGSWSPLLRYAGGAALLAIVPLWVVQGPDSFVTGPVAVVLLLTGLALALWQPRRPAPLAPPVAFPPPTPVGTPAASVPGPATPSADDPAWQLLADGWAAPATADTGRIGSRARREPSILGRLTLGVAVWLGAAWALADQLDGGRLHPEQWFGAAAVVCGAGLLIGVFRGHGRWLIVPAVLAAGAGYVGGTMSRLGIPVGDLAGDRHIWVDSWSGRTDYAERVGVGEIHIQVDTPPTTPVRVDARVGLGSIALDVSSEVTVEIRPRLDHGTITMPGRPTTEQAPASLLIGEGAPDVVVDAWIGRGDLRVHVYDGDPGLGPMQPDITTVPGLPIVPGLGAPDQAGALVPVREDIAMTTDGWTVLGDGEALISPDDEVTTSDPGASYPVDGPGGGIVVLTGWGEYRLLPRSLLVTPSGEVIDLRGLRAEAAATAIPADATAPPTGEGTTTTLAAPTDDATVPVTTTPGG